MKIRMRWEIVGEWGSFQNAQEFMDRIRSGLGGGYVNLGPPLIPDPRTIQVRGYSIDEIEEKAP